MENGIVTYVQNKVSLIRSLKIQFVFFRKISIVILAEELRKIGNFKRKSRGMTE